LQIAFFVNDIEREYENYTTTVLAHQASTRGHRVCYITPEDFVLNPDDSLSAHGRFLPKRDYKDRAEFFQALKSSKDSKIERVDLSEVDVIMLRNDPSIDRIVQPANELVTLQDYRNRYAFYRTDADLQEVHQSLVNYGIPDLCAASMGTKEERDRFCSVLLAIIARCKVRFPTHCAPRTDRDARRRDTRRSPLLSASLMR